VSAAHAGGSAAHQALGLFFSQRRLLWELARREISDRYAGQAFGIAWAVGHPLFLMGLYVFIFAFVFKVRIETSYDLPLDYTTYILAGLIPWLGFQEAMNRGSTAITGSAALVKQTVFPLELLAAKGVLAALFTQLIATAILIAYVLASRGSLHASYALLPVLVVVQAFAMTGVSLLLGAIGPFFRDVKDLVQLFGVAGLYLLPVFYLPAWVPELFKPVVYANPFSYMAWCYQDALYYGRIEHPVAWIVFPLASTAVFVCGCRAFRRLKVLFGNVL